MLAELLSLLATARYQPVGHIPFGNRCVECLLRLSQAGRLQLSHFGDVVSTAQCPASGCASACVLHRVPPASLSVPPAASRQPPSHFGLSTPAAWACIPARSARPQVEALAQLRCVDGLSASPVVSLAVGSARQLEQGRQLDVPQLTQLARCARQGRICAVGGILLRFQLVPAHTRMPAPLFAG